MPKPCVNVVAPSTGEPPCTASRSRSEKVPMPVPPSWPCVACSNSALPATSPKSQPSPYR
ncbi:Uncharacterised protein [Mycobacteroides abscessus]|nr:Uncharacterised protein [Mycobacteroides abscessus]